MMIASLVIATILPLTALAAVPTQLYSPLVPSKILNTTKSLPNPILYPQYTDSNAGKWQLFSPDSWTSGFFPTTLYALNTRAKLCPPSDSNNLGIADWLTLGRSVSSGEIPLENGNGQGHDQGFLSEPFAEELQVNPYNQTAQTAIKAFANLLAARYSPIVGCTRSWNTAAPNFTVIIDNMMNLELLYLAADLTGNNTLRQIAVSHADTTIKNHIRSDGGTWHVIDYDQNTGAVLGKHTSQGYADNSTWSRGQAWAIYGYANMYRRAGKQSYLTTARKVANYFLNNLPAGGVVPWDFNAPVANRPADSSAAMIAANGLILLSQLEQSSTMKRQWLNAAVKLVNDMTALAWRPEWQSLLANGTVNKPANNFLTGTVYGDYYFVRAGNLFVEMGLATCT